MAIRGEKSSWSPLETPMTLMHFVWAEAARPDILTSLLPAKDGQATEDHNRPRLWACGSPGILIASLDVATGQLERFSVPNPTYPPVYFRKESEDKRRTRHRDGASLMAALASTKAVSMVCVNGTQLWVGTERGTLHVMDVPGFFTHHTAVLSDAILCLASGEHGVDVTADVTDDVSESLSSPSSGYHSTAHGGLQWSKSASDMTPMAGVTVRYILAGLANGSVLKFSSTGNADADMDAPFQSPPEEVSLGEAPVKAIVIATDGLAWCGAGTDIVVLQVETLVPVRRFDAQPDKAYSSQRRSLVSHLVNSSLGIWSACWHTPSVQLWDTKTFSRRTSILSQAHDERARWIASSADVSAMAVSQGILTIGTEGGSLLFFDIVPSDSLTSGSAFRPRFLGAEDTGSGMIHCTVPLESKTLDSQCWGQDSSTVVSSMDSPMRLMTCCAVRFDQRRQEAAGSSAGAAGKGLRSRLRVSSRNADDENETKKVEISCWVFRSAQDHDRHQRLRLYYQLIRGAARQPFKFPKLTIERVCPTAAVKTPLGD